MVVRAVTRTAVKAVVSAAGRSAAAADDEFGKEHFADWRGFGEAGVTRLDEREEGADGDFARLAEWLLDASDGRVEEVEETVVVEGDDSDILADAETQAPQGVDHAEEYGGAESEHRIEGKAGPAGWGAG